MGHRTMKATSHVLGREDATNEGQATKLGHVIPCISNGFGSKQGEMVASNELRPGLSPAVGFPGLWSADGSLVHAVTVDSFAVMCGLLLGAPAPTGTGPYLYEFTVPSAPAGTLWHERVYGTAGRYDLDYGVMIAGLKLQVSKQSGNLEATWPLVGTAKHEWENVAPYDPAAATYTDARLSKAFTSVSLDGAASTLITEVSLETTLDAKALDALNGKGYADEIAATGLEHKVSIKGWWDAGSTLRTVADGSLHQLVVRCARPGAADRYIEIEHPEAPLTITDSSSDKDGIRQLALSSRPGVQTGSSSIVIRVSCDIVDLASII